MPERTEGVWDMTDPLKMQNEIERLWSVIRLAQEYREARNRKPTKGREQEIYEKGKALDIALAELNKSGKRRQEFTAKSGLGNFSNANPTMMNNNCNLVPRLNTCLTVQSSEL